MQRTTTASKFTRIIEHRNVRKRIFRTKKSGNCSPVPKKQGFCFEIGKALDGSQKQLPDLWIIDSIVLSIQTRWTFFPWLRSLQLLKTLIFILTPTDGVLLVLKSWNYFLTCLTHTSTRRIKWAAQLILCRHLTLLSNKRAFRRDETTITKIMISLSNTILLKTTLSSLWIPPRRHSAPKDKVRLFFFVVFFNACVRFYNAYLLFLFLIF
jgi:hypothetical protein